MLEFTLAGRSFRIRFWPAVACLLVIAVTLMAARWQTARAHYKQSLEDAYVLAQAQPPLELTAWGADAPPDYIRASVKGTWRTDALIFADNQVKDGQAGYGVYMPLCQTATRCVLVARGWVGHGGRRDRLPTVSTPQGDQQVEGVVTAPAGRFVELSDDAVQGRVWQNVTVDRASRAFGLELAPFILVQGGGADDGLRRDAVRPDFGINKHWMYAAQWYGFALVTLVSGLYAAMRKTGDKS